MKRRASLTCLLLLWLLWLAIHALAAVPLTNYQERVRAARASIVELREQANPLSLAPLRLAQLRASLPANEDVLVETQTVRIDNRWLHELLDVFEQEPALQKHLLDELAIQLTQLDTRVNGPAASDLRTSKREQDALTEILKRSEYQRDQEQSSVIQQWIKRVIKKLVEFLDWLFGKRAPSNFKPNNVTVYLTRFVIVALLLSALLYALHQLRKHWARRKTKPLTADEPREILGERITEATTTDDLLSAAQKLAQQGDYRGAIRRAYIALLYELEQRGKLRLHRAKTNHDYLEALRNEITLFPNFVALTRIFERIWYGNATATEFDFEGFLSGYREMLK